ncbi:NAD(+) synthase [Aminithiophilus ramosus]|uniref:NH(3)-dependent NAD(+) synthetase n=2 Tax=Synergistales TaxID=649776 RepID=A0A9Q7F140_9BACT|nr:NAD(+) synthase [Aminithiophilus ramosus]QTX33582.1 NAD(+) synthase [Aminithiophilus ramosus]QVL37436.1 NAD(+) synthase [Synergistota bacterium]
MNDFYRNPKELVKGITSWLEEHLAAAGAKGALLGLSGGIDSSLLAVLLRRVCGSSMAGLIMPCHSDPRDEKDARQLAETFDIPTERIDLGPAFDQLCTSLPPEDQKRATPLSLGNVKARLRMATLYAVAQPRGFLVCGTSNRVEWTVGYFTKYGDSGSDLLPLADLLKGEVLSIARYLGVPEGIINKPPSAGLWPGQTDEGEMGVSYDALDRYLAFGTATPEVLAFVKKAEIRSEHKRSFPPRCLLPGGDLSEE